MKSAITKSKRPKPVAIDLFCGAGGLTRGFLDAEIHVAAGYDIDEACRYPYEHNNRPAVFCSRSVNEISGKDLLSHYPDGAIKVLVGCAPCQTFSRYTQGLDNFDDPKWFLLGEFARLIKEVKPEIISMENVPDLQRHPILGQFLDVLDAEGFHFTRDPQKQIVFCPDYGVAQQRKRLVLLASKLGPIELIPPTHSPENYRTVESALKDVPPLSAGEVDSDDPLHRCSTLSPLNQRRIQKSLPGGTWKDWPKCLVAKCHRKKSGKSYPGVYSRMVWNAPAPTITTQFFGFGNGRFGHPEQDRALSLREGAILQSFPSTYKFAPDGASYPFKGIGRMIGNAVPVRLGEVVGLSIQAHIKQHYGRNRILHDLELKCAQPPRDKPLQQRSSGSL